MMPRVRFVNEGITLTVKDGTSILDAARSAGVAIETPCNAIGLCGKCRVKMVDTGHLSRAAFHSELLTKAEIERGIVLACQFEVHEDIDVLAEDRSSENRSMRILSGSASFPCRLKPFFTKRFNGRATDVFGDGNLIGSEEGDTSGDIYGISVDIGTTTLVASLIDLSSGKEMASDSMLNPQSSYAQDVLARIKFASNAEGLAVLHKVFVDAYIEMQDAMTKKAGVEVKRIYEIVFSGNTTMLHIACGADPSSLGTYPYTTKIKGGERVASDEFGISHLGSIYLPPIISAFVGADITSGVLVSGLDEIYGASAFIDVGTNGEIVLAKDGILTATSAAAGPAFEGMNISCGMRAAEGAVESFDVGDDGSVSYGVIGDLRPKGICGSGLLDVVGELVRCGVIGKNGRLSSGTQHESLRAALRDVDGKTAFFITDDVYLTQRDVRHVQLAKGAIRAGIEVLMSKLEVSPDSIDRVLIAGSFGYHLNERSLLNIGMLPNNFSGKVNFVGNTSQSGGIAFLLNTDFRKRMKETAQKIDKVELANEPAFEKLFVNFMGF